MCFSDSPNTRTTSSFRKAGPIGQHSQNRKWERDALCLERHGLHVAPELRNCNAAQFSH